MDWEDIAYLFGLGVTAFVACKGGEKMAYEKIANENKDAELRRLREKLEALKKQTKPN